MSESLLNDSAANEGQVQASERPAPNGGTWVDGLPDEFKGMVEHKGWKEPGDALKSYKDLESYMGADKAGRGMVLPKDENDSEGFNKIYTALGRPENPEEYGLMSVVGESEYDKGLLDKVSGAMHQAGLSTKQAQAVTKAYQEEAAALQESQRLRFLDEQKEVKAVSTPETIETARRGFRHLELSEDDAVVIEAYLGPKKAVGLFERIGRLLSEDKAPQGKNASSGSSYSLSPETALRRREELLSDNLFLKRYMNSEASAISEIDNLNIQIAKGQQRAE